MSHADSNYPRDEFDNYVGHNGGAHRGQKTMMSRVMPFIVAIVVALVCAFMFLAWTNGWLGQRGVKSTSAVQTAQQSSQMTSPQQSQPSEEAPKSDTTSADTSRTDSQSSADKTHQNSTKASNVDYTAVVYVLNATGKTGYAGQKAKVLKDAGYTSVTAANYTDAKGPENSAVFYVNDSDKATAEEIAQKLGIATVAKQDTLRRGKIEVVLRD